jgi:transcriptional regulator with XRE-family HTH domain
MRRDPVATFREKIGKHRIRGNKLAEESGKSAGNISEILNDRVIPKVDNLVELIEAADRLSPGFADDYYCSLAGHAELNTLIGSLGVSELSKLLILVSHRLDELVPSKVIAV